MPRSGPFPSAGQGGEAPVLGFATLTLGQVELATRALRAHPPNWIQTNLAPRGEIKPVGFIESFGALLQTPGRLLCKNVAARPPAGAQPQSPLELRPKPRSAGGLGWESPTGPGAELQAPPPPPPPPGYGVALSWHRIIAFKVYDFQPNANTRFLMLRRKTR